MRSARSLGALVRLLFVFLVVGAVAVDLWAIGRFWFIDRHLTDPEVLLFFVIGAIGIVWSWRPQWALGLGASAAALSLVETALSPGIGLRIGAFTEFVVLPVLLGGVLTLSRRDRFPIAVLIAGAAMVLPLRAEDTAIRALLALPMVALLGIAVIVVTYLRLRDTERQASVEAARHDERVEIARELHDVVGHHVTGIVILAQASRFTSEAPPGSPIDRTFADIEAAGLDTLAALRRLVGVLRAEATTAAAATLDDIERLVEGLAATHRRARLVVDERVRAGWVPAELATTVQRLAQEAVTNVRRHGDPDGDVEFRLTTDGSVLTLTVSNECARQPVGRGFGVVGMRERVEALGGSFRAGAEPLGDRARWVVRATLPTGSTTAVGA